MDRYLLDREQVLALIDDPQLRLQVAGLPLITPQVYIDVTGGVVDVIASDYRVGVNSMDYDITEGEDPGYYVDPDGTEVWIYGDTCQPDPEKCKEIESWPTREELDDACDRCGEDASGGDGYAGLCGNCADLEEADA
jgi:hypothetical protein